MNEVGLLQKLHSLNVENALELVFVGRVCEFLGQLDSFSTHFEEGQLNVEGYELEESLMYDGMDTFMPAVVALCGAGECGFCFHSDTAFLSILDEEDEDFLDNLAIETDGFKDGKELLDFLVKFDNCCINSDEYEGIRARLLEDGGLWDLLKAHYSGGYVDLMPDYVHGDAKWDLAKCIVTAWFDSGGDGYFGRQNFCQITNPSLDKWLSFLRTPAVSQKDRKRSKAALSKLFSRSMTGDSFNTEIICYSHSDDSTALWQEKTDATDREHSFLMLCYQMNDSSYGGGPLVSSFETGLLSTMFLATMLEVKTFLEKMEEKYHFLSIGTEVNADEEKAA